jgi:AbrB family looped-hinge helix DNA binding protein
MKIQSHKGASVTAVKIGVSRQVVIPKKLHEELGLAPGDYLDVELKEGKVVMTPKTLVDKKIQKRLEEGLEDIRQGRVLGPFDNSKDAMKALRAQVKARRK